MPDYSMDEDPDYWQAPERFRALFERVQSFGLRASYFPLGDPDTDTTARSRWWSRCRPASRSCATPTPATASR